MVAVIKRPIFRGDISIFALGGDVEQRFEIEFAADELCWRFTAK